MEKTKNLAWHVTTESNFHEILAEGYIEARGGMRGRGESGKSFRLDFLAGDSGKVFFSYGQRFWNESDDSFAFLFDAELLVKAGAAVGRDLMSRYDDLLDDCINRVDAKLPRKRVDEKACIEFVNSFCDGDMRIFEAMLESEASNYADLLDAVNFGDVKVKGAAEVEALFVAGAKSLQCKHRCIGETALDLLREGEADGTLEIVCSGRVTLNRESGFLGTWTRDGGFSWADEGVIR